jgi:TetR/AcrR family transcriptional regulator, transcriptional repressor of bet genes
MARRGLEKGISDRAAEKDRRGAIRYGLYRCIRDKGYAATSLADVASAAGLSPSHLLYYYGSKEAVLEDLFTVATRHLLESLAELPWEDPPTAFDALADYYFDGRAFSRTELSTMLQFWGLSTHYPRIREIKAGFDDEIRERLDGVFARTRRQPDLSARDAAEIAYGLLSGLLTVTYSSDLEPARARSLFRRTLARLAGERAPRKEP